MFSVLTAIVFLIPYIFTVAAVYVFGDTFGHAITASFVGGAIGYFVMWSSEVFIFNNLKFHEGIVCVRGYHLPWSFMLGMIFPTVLATASSAVVLHFTPDYIDLLPGALAYAVAALVFTRVWRKTTPFWEDEWETFVQATVGHQEDPHAPKAVRDANHQISWLFETTGPALTVREFELVLWQALVFRGYALDLEPNVVTDVLKEMSFDDPEKRKAWIERELTQEVWADVAPAYEEFVRRVRQAQAKAQQAQENDDA